MATQLAQDIEKEVTCAICLDRLADPKVMPCLHNYCRRCIEKLVLRPTEDHCVKCPLCQEEHAVPSEGFATNFTLQNIIELLRVASVKKEDKVLSCENGLDESPATARCLDCAAYLCTTCWDAHKKMVATRDHQTVSLTENIDTGDKCFQRSRHCPAHEREVLKLYCEECSVPICGDCVYSDSHRGHKVVLIADIQQDLRKELQEALTPLAEKERDTRDSLEHANKTLAKHHENVEESMKRINSQFDTWVDMLQQHRQDVIEDLISSAEKEEKTLKGAVDTSQVALAKLSSNLKFAKRLLESGSDVDVASMGPQVLERSSQVLYARTRMELRTGSWCLVSEVSDRTVTMTSTSDEALNQDNKTKASSWCLEGDTDKISSVIKSMHVVHTIPREAIVVEGIEKIGCGKNHFKVAISKIYPVKNIPYEMKAVITVCSKQIQHTIKKNGDRSWTVTFILKVPTDCSIAVRVNGTLLDYSVNAMDLVPGTRVRRGPNWVWGNQDSRAFGKVVGPSEPHGWVKIKWDHGSTDSYRWGADKAFDLKVLTEQ